MFCRVDGEDDDPEAVVVGALWYLWVIVSFVEVGL